MARKKATTDKTTTSRKAAKLALAVSLVAPSVGQMAHAVVLGSVQVQSNLGQPLVAEVELLNADQESLKTGIAPPGVYQQHSFQVPYQLGHVNVRMVQKRDGRRVLRVTSERAVNEPTLELLLQAEDRAGSIVRYIPLLIDPAPAGSSRPPRVAERQEREPLSVELPIETAPAQAARSARAEARTPEQKKSRAPSRAESSDVAVAAGASKKRAARKEESATAASATSKHEPAAATAVAQTDTKAQAEAAGAGVRAPSPVHEAPKVATATAADQARVPPVPGAATLAAQAPTPSSSAVGAASNVDAAAAAAAAAVASASQPTAGTASATVTAQAPESVAVSSAPVPSQERSAATAIAAAGPSASHATAAAVSTRSPPAEGWSTGSYALAGTGIVLAGGLLALGLRQRRRNEEQELQELREGLADSTLVFGGDERARATRSGVRRGTKQPTTRGSSVFSTSSFHMMDEVDPLAEADVYMAYGRTDHAQAILEDAIHEHPERAALYLKLLSIHQERKNPLAFNDLARALAKVTNGEGPEWQQAVAMGLRMDPGNFLYTAPYRPGSSKGKADFKVTSSSPPSRFDRRAAGRPSTLQEELRRADTEWPTSEKSVTTPAPVSTPEPAPAPATGPIDFAISVSPATTDAVSNPVSTTDVDLPLQDASAPVPADAQDSHLIDFEISGMGSEPMQLEVAPALAHPTSAPADTGVAAAIAETRYRTSVEAETVAGAHAAAANASRFDALPAKLALVRELTQAGEPQHAAEVAQEIAALIAELRSEAFHIMVAAQRRA